MYYFLVCARKNKSKTNELANNKQIDNETIKADRWKQLFKDVLSRKSSSFNFLAKSLQNTCEQPAFLSKANFFKGIFPGFCKSF